MRTFGVAIILGVLLVDVAGCSSSSTSPTPTPTPVGVQHLYVTDNGSPGTVFVFNLPLTATSTPTVTLLTTGNGAANPCFDNAGSHIYVPMDGSDTVQVFALPLTASSTPAFTLTTTSTGEDCHFDGSGNLYVAESAGSKIEVFKAPVASGSIVNSTITGAALVNPWGIWTDASGNVFSSTHPSAAVEYSAFPTNAQTAAFGPTSNDQFGLALGPSGSLYAANATAAGVIDVYDPPFSNSSTKNVAETITTPLTNWVSYMAFDAAGNLYAGGSAATFHVLVYASPYTGAPVDLNRGATRVQGVAIGP
jgi:hypothetical protein